MTQTCRSQVDEYLGLYAAGMPDTQLRPSNRTGNLGTLLTKASPRIVVFFACGIVDLLTAFNWGCWDRPVAQQLSGLIVASQFGMLGELYDKANVRDFLVVNLFPAQRGMDPSNVHGVEVMGGFVGTANALYQTAMANFTAARPDAAMKIVDWNSAMNNLYDNPNSSLAQEYFGPTGVDMYRP